MLADEPLRAPPTGPDGGSLGLRVRVLRLAYRLAWRLLMLGSPLTSPLGRRGVKCVLTHSGRVLLVRHSYGPRRLWILPGGGSDRGESPQETATREMREELGVEVLSWEELQHEDPRLRRVLPRSAFLHGRCPSEHIRPDPVEIEEARWWSLEGLPVRVGDEVRPALALLGAAGGVLPAAGEVREGSDP